MENYMERLATASTLKRYSIIISLDAFDAVYARLGRRGAQLEWCESVIVGKQARITYNVPMPLEKTETPSMQFAMIRSEETMFGPLYDGRIVYVECVIFDKAPEPERDNPDYWRARIEAGKFKDAENAPMAWIERPPRL